MSRRTWAPSRASFVGLLVAWIVGCATLPSPHVPGLENVSTATVASIPARFVVEGRFAAQHEGEGVTGRFVWQRTAHEEETWQLLSPTGNEVARLTVTGHDATLTVPGQPPRSAPNPETLVAPLLGFALPPWAIWRAAVWGWCPVDANPPAVEPIAHESAQALGWTWRWSERDANGWPRRIEISRGDTRLILVVATRQGDGS
ncbi:outer membrane lipoprotein LolB [Hydrogenophilus thiooxidans]|uniref:outer membrane lipoprotein LolB n=1 Tax=Hydrogenophilus thiooxidans TaxID=2820326 RepID=UPI001C22FA26|nr:outer membrane lipoprotein LolB [Hydrogenophilus thiooxidans]